MRPPFRTLIEAGVFGSLAAIIILSLALYLTKTPLDQSGDTTAAASASEQ